MTTKLERRIKIKYRVRNKISGTAARPRMSVFRSNKQIYVQIINDLTGTTLASASSLGMEACPKKEQAAKVGELIAKKPSCKILDTTKSRPRNCFTCSNVRPARALFVAQSVILCGLT